jgi:hypothetical protein
LGLGLLSLRERKGGDMGRDDDVVAQKPQKPQRSDVVVRFDPDQLALITKALGDSETLSAGNALRTVVLAILDSQGRKLDRLLAGVGDGDPAKLDAIVAALQALHDRSAAAQQKIEDALGRNQP